MASDQFDRKILDFADKSLWLNKKMRERLCNILPELTREKKEKLVLILKREREFFLRLLADFFKKYGDSGKKKLDEILSGARKKILRKKENMEQPRESEKMEALLKQL